MCISSSFCYNPKMSDEAKQVPNEGTGALPPAKNEITVLPDGVTYLTDGTGNLIVLPPERSVDAVRNVLAPQANTNTIPL